MVETASLFILGSFVVACSAKVGRLPEPGESLRAEAFTVQAGGKGLNLAIGARRLGAKVDGLLAIGNDFFSDLAEPALVRADLPASMLRRYEAATGSGIGFTDAQGENCLAVYPGANMLLTGDEVRRSSAALRGTALVLAQFELEDGPILEAFALARDGGIRTLLNASPYRPPSGRLLERTSILVLNKVEARQLGKSFGLPSDLAAEPDLPALASAVIEQGPDTLVVTLGADGAVAFGPDGATLHQPAFEVRTLDTLGAGDAFTAGLAVSLTEGRSLSESLKRAAAAGAIATEKLGVFDALPTKADLDHFLGRRRKRF